MQQVNGETNRVHVLGQDPFCPLATTKPDVADVAQVADIADIADVAVGNVAVGNKGVVVARVADVSGAFLAASGRPRGPSGFARPRLLGFSDAARDAPFLRLPRV